MSCGFSDYIRGLSRVDQCPPNPCPLRTCQCDHIRKYSLCRHKHLKWGHTGPERACSLRTGKIQREGNLDIEAQRGHATAQAETGVTQLQSEEPQGWLATPEVWIGTEIPPGAIGGSMALLTPWPRLLASGTEGDAFLLNSATLFAVTCHGSSGKRTQGAAFGFPFLWDQGTEVVKTLTKLDARRSKWEVPKLFESSYLLPALMNRPILAVGA